MSHPLSRRTALRGSLTASLGLVAGVPAASAAGALSSSDRRLVKLADIMWAIHDTAEAHIVRHRCRETDETEAEFSALIERYSPVEDELAATAATSLLGVMAKARACQVPILRDIDGGPVALSLADDLVRIHGAGRSVMADRRAFPADERLDAIAAELGVLQVKAERLAPHAEGSAEDPYTETVFQMDQLGEEAAGLPADTMAGVLAKLRALSVPIIGEESGPGDLLRQSVCRDVDCLHTAGRIAHA